MTTGIVGRFIDMQRQLSGPRFKIGRPPAGLPPDSVERSYREFILGIVDAVNADVVDEVVPLLPRLERMALDGADAVRLDVEDIEAMVDRAGEVVRVRLNNRHLRELDAKIDEYRAATSVHQRRELRKQLRALISLDAFPDAGAKERTILDGWIAANRKRIKSLTTAQIEEVEDLVLRSVQSGERATLIQERIADRWAVVRSRAALIARDQVNKLHGNLTRVRQTSLGIERYVWRTSRDERVRNTHIVKEGRIFDWSKPPFDTGHPGQDIQCRCTAEPYIEGEPPPKEDRQKVIKETLAQRERLREELLRRGKASARLIPTKRPPGY